MRLLLLIPEIFCSMSLRAQALTNPQADPRAIVIAGEARFTVLTPQLIRMEWSAQSHFVDAASLVFINRNLPVPDFAVRDEDDWLVLTTDSLTVRYKKDSGKFRRQNLEVQFMFNGEEGWWSPGLRDTGNLLGTTRTLDGARGPVGLETGLLSRGGWVLIDDSKRPLLDSSDCAWVVPRKDTSGQDWYFFGHGHNYKRALYDFIHVAGRIPLPPRFAFGLWWSRYWAYTDAELKELVHEFEVHDVPLDVLVIDMDWHKTFNLRWDRPEKDQAGQRLGWTGYTWDSTYFPDPPAFLSWCEGKGLKTPLNLHPASGVQPHEALYPEMARAMGIDPRTKRYIPFEITDKKFATNFLNIILKPLENQGVDFWWLDWQQWHTTGIEGVTPTWWLNYVFFTDMERKAKARPLLFHRWGGLGNHRYQIGFSGDAASQWNVLSFEEYFTATAANVGFGYWSHDIGGHFPGPVTPEMYTRWIQFGAFSPILRTHTTKNAEAERRIWAYPERYFEIMRDAFLLRYRLIPYIYAAARQAYETGVSICRPMYYDYPEADEAYAYNEQYMFGADIIAAPVAGPLSPDSDLVAKKIWIPEGDWYEFFSGMKLTGPHVFTRTFALDEIPLYLRAGAIIPMQPKMKNTREKTVDPLILTIYPGASDTIRVYDDAGNSLGYQKNEYTRTRVVAERSSDGSLTVEIDPVQGSFPGMINRRSYEIRLPCALPPIAVEINNVPSNAWNYDGNSMTTNIPTPTFNVHEKVVVNIELHQSASSLTNGVPGMIARLRDIVPMLDATWPKEWSPDSLVVAVQTGNRMSLHPEAAAAELERLHKLVPTVLNEIKAMNIDDRLKRRIRFHLVDIGN